MSTPVGTVEALAGTASPDRGEQSLRGNAMISETIPGRVLVELNWMRALAAIAVLAGHIRGIFFVDHDAHQSAFTQVVYLFTGLGHQAVVVFFVLSGFFIGTSVAAPSRHGTWSMPRFALRRFTRLYVVIIPALLLTFVWDRLGMMLFGVQGIYGGNLNAPFLTIPDVRTTLNVQTLLANLCFMQEVIRRTPPLGSNGPLWSISYEFWAYVSFPLLFQAALGSGSAGGRIVAGVCAAGLLVSLGTLFQFYLVIWGLGALVAMVWAARPRRMAFRSRAVTVIAHAGFWSMLLAGRLRLLHQKRIEDLLLGVATAALVAVLLGRTRYLSAGAPKRGPVERWGEILAGFSFTLYASHYPVVTFLQAWLVGINRWTPDYPHALVAIVLGVAILGGYAYPLARLTELRTEDVRRALERRLFRRAARAS